MTAGNGEVGKDTDATLSCKISGITKKLDKVEWRDTTTGTALTGDNYVVTAGEYVTDTNSQTTTILVKGAENTADKSYYCVVSAGDWAVNDKITTVKLRVFGNSFLVQV